jgi:hypothetical protein
LLCTRDPKRERDRDAEEGTEPRERGRETQTKGQRLKEGLETERGVRDLEGRRDRYAEKEGDRYRKRGRQGPRDRDPNRRDRGPK